MDTATSPHAQVAPGHDALRLALEKAGGGAHLARLLGVTRFAVQQWKATGVPAARVPAVTRATGVPMHLLRPDIFDAPPQPGPDLAEAFGVAPPASAHQEAA